MVYVRSGPMPVVPARVLWTVLRSVLRLVCVGRWAMAAITAMRLGLRHCAETQCQKCGDRDGKSQTLKLHGASFLRKKDSSPNWR